MKIGDNSFSWLNTSKNAFELRRLVEERLEPAMCIKSLERANNDFEKFIILNQLMPVITFSDDSGVKLLEEKIGFKEITRKYEQGEFKIIERISITDDCDVSVRYSRIDYSGQSNSHGLQPMKSIGQEFNVESDDKSWIWGAHYSCYYFIKNEARKLSKIITDNNQLLKDYFG